MSAPQLNEVEQVIVECMAEAFMMGVIASKKKFRDESAVQQLWLRHTDDVSQAAQGYYRRLKSRLNDAGLEVPPDTPEQGEQA